MLVVYICARHPSCMYVYMLFSKLVLVVFGLIAFALFWIGRRTMGNLCLESNLITTPRKEIPFCLPL